MTETINYVREDSIQDERTAGMFQLVNENHDRMTEAERQAFRQHQARIRALEAEARAEEHARQQRIAEIQKLAWMAFGWVAGCALLIILEEIGAIIGPVMQVGTTALSLAFGATIGKIV